MKREGRKPFPLFVWGMPPLTELFIVDTYNYMKIDFDATKSERNARERGLPFELATEIFASVNVTFEDNRTDYRETRFVTVGFIAGRMAVVVWTPRGAVSRIISMRYANGREIEKYSTKLG